MQAWLGKQQQQPTRAIINREPSRTASCCLYPGPCQPRTTEQPNSGISPSDDIESNTEPPVSTTKKNTITNSTLFIGVASSASLFVVVVICGVVTIIFLKRKSKSAKETDRRDEDLNPVYGIYYSSSGDRIDDGVHEIVDENEY